MDRNEVLAKVIELIGEITGESTEGITEASNLITEVEVSSIEVLSLIGDIEAEYDIRIDTDELREIATVGDLINIIVK